MSQRQVLAADFGASSGRVMLGRFDGQRLGLEELHRFSNDPVRLGGTMYWDFLRLFHEVQQGLLKAKAYGPADSIGVDTWGVDFGLVDKTGRLIGNPVHYRDNRTAGMLEKAFRRMDKEVLYHITGNQFMEINTLFQLLYMAENQIGELERAKSLLMMPDLFHYYLSGVPSCDCSIASTTQMMDARSKQWAYPVMKELGIPGRLMQDIVPCGTRIGALRPDLCEELGISSMAVTAVAGHDTQCALAAIPAKEKDFIFISCGTWSLFGTELDAPIINKASVRLNLTNETGCGGKTSFLKNIIGLWLVQESRRQWRRDGREYNFGELEQMAGRAKPFMAFVDPDAPEFVPAGNVPERIRTFCRNSAQEMPQTEGEIVRCINESLALKYRMTLEEIRECTGKEYKAVHLAGGGAQSAQLCQMTANACGCPVIAGPVEATVYGNAAIQLMALGELKNLSEIREVVQNSENPVVYEPQDREIWEEVYGRFRKMISGC